MSLNILKSIKGLAISSLFLGLLIVPSKIYAQDELNKEVSVTRAYDPIISDADKILLHLSPTDTLLNLDQKFDYRIQNKGIKSNFSLRPIPVAKIKGSDYEDPQWLYLRLGAGYPLGLLGDLYINNINPENLSLGLFYNNRSLFHSVDAPNGKDIPMDEMNHGGGVFIRKYFDKFSLGAIGGIKQHSVLFYGYDKNLHEINSFSDFALQKDSIKQTYNNFFLDVDILSNTRDKNDFRYGAKLFMEFFSDRGNGQFNKGRMFSMKENTFGGNLFLAKPIGNHLFSLDGDVSIYNRSLDFNRKYNAVNVVDRPMLGNLYNDLYALSEGKDTTATRYRFNVEPRYTFSTGKFHLSLGAKFTGYKTHNKFKSRIYPMADVNALLADEFVPYGRLDGGVIMNSYQEIANENPYILPGMNMTMLPTNNTYGVQIGIKGNISKIFSYNLYGKYSQFKDAYFYKTNYNNSLSPDYNSSQRDQLFSLKNNFDVVYDDIEEWKGVAEVQVVYKGIHASLGASYYNYVLTDVEKAFHKPNFTLDFSFEYNIKKRFIIDLDIHFRDKTPHLYSITAGESYYNKEYVKLDLGLEYLFNRTVSVFVRGNNLLNKKYEIWHQYKVPGIGVLGGVTLKL